MQEDFAGALARAGELLTFEVYLADVLGLHQALADHRRRAEHFLVVDPVADVAVVGRGEALGVDAPADVANLLFNLVFVQHGITSGSVDRGCRRSTHRPASSRGGTGPPPRRPR